MVPCVGGGTELRDSLADDQYYNKLIKICQTIVNSILWVIYMVGIKWPGRLVKSMRRWRPGQRLGLVVDDRSAWLQLIHMGYCGC
jgi:hypothetical protein